MEFKGYLVQTYAKMYNFIIVVEDEQSNESPEAEGELFEENAEDSGANKQKKLNIIVTNLRAMYQQFFSASLI